MRWIFWLAFLLIGCGQPAVPRPQSVVVPTTRPASAAQLQVKVDRTGRLFLNGKVASLDDLKQELAGLKEAGGSVRFFHDNPTGETNAQSLEALRAIASAKVPLRIQNADFD